MTYSQADITVPYAVANFAEIRHKGYYYVDKTNYIPLLERYKAPVFLRPRRFGKSLLVSMLAHYYDPQHGNTIRGFIWWNLDWRTPNKRAQPISRCKI